MLVNVILILLLLGFIGTGWKDGAIQTLGRVVGAVIGFLVARSWSIGLAALFEIVLPSGWARLAAFLVVFLFITRIVGFIFKLADGAFKILSFIPFVKPLNSLLGAIVGIVEGFVVLGGSIWIVQNFTLLPFLAKLLASSVVARGILAVFEFLLKLVI